MERPQKKGTAADIILLDSGTTSHMTLISKNVTSKESCAVHLMLGDDSKVKASTRGVRRVQWQTENGPCTVSLSNTLVLKDLTMSLLSIPALVQKQIATLVLPRKALFIDLKYEYSILGKATQVEYGMFYISDNQDNKEAVPNIGDKELSAMMAVVKQYKITSKNVEDSDVEGGEGNAPTDRESSTIEDVETDDENIKSGEDKDIEEGRKKICETDATTIWHLRLGHVLLVGTVNKN